MWSLLKRLFGRPSLPTALRVGGLYAIPHEHGFQVVKILVVDTNVIHIRVYRNVFAVIPADIDESGLKLGSLDDEDGFGMGHLPLSIEKFASWNAKFLKRSSVADEELEGYKLWKESDGGVW